MTEPSLCVRENAMDSLRRKPEFAETSGPRLLFGEGGGQAY